jgi:hypothetical protein
MKPVFFLPHLGLGDHFTFNGALREIYKEYNYMVMPVKENEQKLFKECFENLKEGEYVFLHDDPTRGRVIKKEHLPDLQIVTPHKKFWDADILDYRYLIENSFEIHCVNSSFSDLMDSFDLSKVKRLCIHEYARTGDPVHYKHNFEVIYN